MKSRFVALIGPILLTALASGDGHAQLGLPELDRPLPVDPMVKVDTLENGLTYYIRTNHRPENRAELRLVVNAGSVLEDSDQLGLAHFVEHMAFNGTERFPKQDLIDYLERIGMRFGPELNAYTSFDETVFILQIPTDSTEIVTTAFQILEDWARNLTFDPQMVDSERGVVVEEWRMGRGADSRMFDRQFPVLFEGSQYAVRMPLGDTAIIKGFEYSSLERFYEDWYRPDLMAVVAVGDFDASEIERLIRRHFSQLTSPPSPRERNVYPVPDHDETLIAIAADQEATESRVSIYYKQQLRETNTVSAFRRLIVERLYNSMLNDRLFELTQQSDPPFLYGSSGQGRLIRSKEVYVIGAVVEDGGVERGLEALLTETERVAQHGFTDTELERHRAELLRWMEQANAEREKTNSSSYAYEYVQAFLNSDPIPGVAIEYEYYQRFLPEIELAEVNRLAREWLVDRNRVIMVNAPDKEGLVTPSESALLGVFEMVKGRAVEPYADSVDDTPLVGAQPVPGQIKSEELDEELGITTWTLSNGARVILKPTDFKDDEILFRASSPGGTSLASDEDYIAASTAAQVVSFSGLGNFGMVELQKKLAGKAVGVGASFGSLYEGLGGSGSPGDVETLFELIYLSFAAPRRDIVAYQALRKQIDAILANRDASPMDVFQDTLTATLSQYHFRARSATAKVYEEMDLDKSLDFYRDRFADAGDFTFVFVGNFETEQLRPLVRTYLASLPTNGRVESWRDVGIRPPEGVVVKEVRRGIEPKSRTHIVFTGVFEYNRQNQHLIASLADVLQIRLRERLREDMGGTYSVSVSARPERDPVPSFSILISFGADPGRLEELAGVVFEEIEGVKTQDSLGADVAKVRESQRRSLETNLKQNNYWLWQLVAADRLGIEPREALVYNSLIEELNVEMIREAARMYLPTQNYIRVSLLPERDDWQ